MILACDVGGTKVRLAIYSHQEGSFERKETETYPSREYSNLEEIIESFLKKHSTSIDRACFGIAGPVVNGAAKPTNLSWRVSEKELAKTLGISAVKLVNDLSATTAAIPHFSSDDLLTLHSGEPIEGGVKIFATVAPGTGFGQGILYMKSNDIHVLASEGGHVDFAPSNDVEIELLKYLQNRFGHVSYERVLCGPGLINIYDFLKEENQADEPEELTARLETDDPAAVISKAGQSGEFEICVKALDIFVSILGAQAGNLALTLMATAGVYLGGGIPPKICDKLRDGTVVEAFLNKGRLSYMVERTPLHIIRNDHAALLGAASIAAKLG